MDQLTLTAGQTVNIMGGYSRKPFATGTVQRVLKNYVVVRTAHYACDVRYRTTGRLCVVRIIGGLVESLNDYIAAA